MKNIYHIHQSSNSYWDSRWTETDYYLCDSEDEYQQKLAEYTEKRKQIEKEFKENPTELSKSRALFLQQVSCIVLSAQQGAKGTC